MRTLLSTVLTSSIALLAACGGSSKAKPDAPPTPMPDGPPPTANGVFPAQGFAGRTLRVEVTGDQTTWSSSTTVSFGSDLTTANVAVASPTDLFVDVTIPDNATIGLHDVTVTNGSEMYTLKQAFEVDVPTTFSSVGTLAQGSILTFTIKNVDTANPFDTTIDPTTGAFSNISITGPNGVYLEAQNVTDFEIDGEMLIDVNGTAGAAVVTSGPVGSTLDFPVGNVAVANRTAIALTSGSAMTGNVAGTYDTQLYMYTPGTSPDLLDVTLSTTSTTAQVAAIQLGSTGSFTGPLTYGSFAISVNATASASYYIYWDNSGASGYSYSITATDTALSTTTHLAATGNTPSAAILVTAPGYADMGSTALTSGSFVGQWMKVAVTSGKVLRVVTGGNPNTNTQVAIYSSLPTATSTPVVTCNDNEVWTDNGVGYLVTLGEDCSAPAATATGTYYINVLPASPNQGTGSDFTAAITVK